MHIAIIYFSQTGNTRKVAQIMAQTFQQAGHATRMIALKDVSVPDIMQCDAIGFGAPCFASQAPLPVRRFLKGLPGLENKKAWVFATTGGGPGNVLSDMSVILRKKGAQVIGGFMARGEIFYPLPSLQGRFPGRPDAQDLQAAARFAQAAEAFISSGHTGLMPQSRADALRRGWGFYALLGLCVPDSLAGICMPKPRLDEAACNTCGWCRAACPVNAITMDTYPLITKDCIRCYRCLGGCPRKAWQMRWRLENSMIGFLYNPFFERWLGDVKAGERFY